MLPTPYSRYCGLFKVCGFAALLLFAGCANKPLDHAHVVQDYSCDQLAAELRFLEREKVNLRVLQEKHSTSQDVGAFVASIGTHAIGEDHSLSGASDIGNRLASNAVKQSNIRKLTNEKC